MTYKPLSERGITIIVIILYLVLVGSVYLYDSDHVAFAAICLVGVFIPYFVSRQFSRVLGSQIPAEGFNGQLIAYLSIGTILFWSVSCGAYYWFFKELNAVYVIYENSMLMFWPPFAIFMGIHMFVTIFYAAYDHRKPRPRIGTSELPNKELRKDGDLEKHPYLQPESKRETPESNDQPPAEEITQETSTTTTTHEASET